MIEKRKRATWSRLVSKGSFFMVGGSFVAGIDSPALDSHRRGA
ncbi:MAG: hypothetical protein R3F49_05810 [Planctomycetota bacterium]